MPAVTWMAFWAILFGCWEVAQQPEQPTDKRPTQVQPLASQPPSQQEDSPR